jgi:hypothetical protein
MKYLYLILAVCIITACNQNGKKANETSADTSMPVTPVIEQKDSLSAEGNAQADTLLLQTSHTILTTLKQKDFQTLSGFIHPGWQLLFSPYAYIDTTHSQVLSPYELQAAAKKSSVLTWGTYDGSGEPIKMNIFQYFDKFVYNKDYLNAKEKSVNKFIAGGNSLNNLKGIYPGSDFTEFYFPGFDPKYDGMDWQTLRLVFRKENNKLYLIAIVHDQWTI